MNSINKKFLLIILTINILNSTTFWGFGGEFAYSQSTQQAFYFFQDIYINGNTIDSEDWVGAFINRNGIDVCVGAKRWDTANCGGGICEVPVMGDDGSEWTIDYMNSGEYPFFKILDVSEKIIYNTIPSGTVIESGQNCTSGYPACYAWNNYFLPFISTLSTTDIDIDINSDYEFTGSIVASIQTNIEIVEEDYLIAIIDGEIRGMNTLDSGSPFGNVVFPLMIYNDNAGGDMVSFVLHDFSEGVGHNIINEMEFIVNMIEGNDQNPLLFFTDGFSMPGCTDFTACNYNVEANEDDGSCEYADTNFDCNGDELSIDIENSLPNENEFIQIYPNPFNPNINIKIYSESPEYIAISAYNLSGKKIDIIYSGLSTIGYHTYKWNPTGLYSGVYFIHVTTPTTTSIKKVNLVK